jgi:hypothetical protein
MTVYVDDWRQRARIGRITARWSHLTAEPGDDLEELHVLAACIGPLVVPGQAVAACSRRRDRLEAAAGNRCRNGTGHLAGCRPAGGRGDEQ